MRHFILIVFIFTAAAAWAAEDTTAVTDQLIMAEMAEDGQAQESTQGSSKKEYESKRYIVEEETDIVERALNVFKSKGKSSSLYRKKVWLYNTLEDKDNVYISFTTNDQNAGIIFSPDEEFVYYLEMTPDGERRLNGIKIVGQEEFMISPAGNFFIETCAGRKKSYVIVTGDDPKTYHVFDLNGEAVTVPDMPSDIDDLIDIICY